MIATSIEQSKKLLSLGLKPETTDMYHYEKNDGWVTLPKEFSYGGFTIIPAWSLTALWNLLPIDIENEGVKYYQNVGRGGTGAYTFEYMNPHKEPWEVNYWIHCTSKDNPIDAVVEMIEWLVTNKHLKV